MSVDSILRDVVGGNLLRYAAGQQISCPGCEQILDWRETVIFNVKPVAIVCTDCAEPILMRLAAKLDPLEFAQKLERVDCAHNIYADGRIGDAVHHTDVSRSLTDLAEDE